jgi:nucleoside-diphosphate-sugar epimerase
VLNNLVGHAVLTGTVRVLSDGTPWRPLVHARDIARAFAACLTAPKEAIDCQAFNVGTEANNVTVAQIAEAVVAAVPGSTLLITGENGADPRSYRVDFEKARRVLGYEARWTVAEGAAELYTEYLTNGLSGHEFTHTFTRLAQLESLRSDGILDATMRRVSATA